MITLTYDADQTASIYVNNTNTSFTGCWKCNADYDSTITHQLRHSSGNYVASAKMYRYIVLLQKNETTLVPVNSLNNNLTTTKTLTTESFDPFGQILYYNSTTAVSANGNISGSTLFTQFNIDLRYSFNTGATLVTNKDVYIVAVPQTDGMAKLHTAPIS